MCRRIPLNAIMADVSTTNMSLPAYLALLVGVSNARHWEVSISHEHFDILVCRMTYLWGSLVSSWCIDHLPWKFGTQCTRTMHKSLFTWLFLMHFLRFFLHTKYNYIQALLKPCSIKIFSFAYNFVFLFCSHKAARELYNYMLDNPTEEIPTGFFLHLAAKRMDDNQLLPALEVCADEILRWVVRGFRLHWQLSHHKHVWHMSGTCALLHMENIWFPRYSSKKARLSYMYFLHHVCGVEFPWHYTPEHGFPTSWKESCPGVFWNTVLAQRAGYLGNRAACMSQNMCAITWKITHSSPVLYYRLLRVKIPLGIP